MSTTEVDRVAERPTTSPARVGQATAVEQSRAMAEVQAAVVVAQQCPRNREMALREMRDSCRQMRLAERAFFRFSRGGSTVSGPTVHLARELARIWGNIQYGISELSRDDEHGQSEMQAFAWDLQANTRSAQIFIVPHMRDKRGGAEKLTDMRDIYENNTNQGSRRLRQAIWSVLPPWFVEEAEELCNKTLKDGGGKPLAIRVADAIAAFQTKGISPDRMERKVGRKSGDWTEWDVAQFGVVFKSLERGEVTIEEEFPQERVTAAELTGLAVTEHAKPPANDNGEPTDPADSGWPEVPGPGTKAKP